jgi:hypothetical protein
MFDKWLQLPAHKYLHLLGCLLIGVGLPLNKVVMSIGTIWVIANVVIEGDYKTYLKNLKNNRVFLLILGLFLLHFVSVFWTEDITYALGDIRSKLPLLVIPLALIAKPLEKDFIPLVLYGFILSILATSVINVSLFYTNGHFSDGTDIRYMSLFGSHIRYGLIVVFGFAASLNFIKRTNKLSWIWIIPAAWFLIYSLIAQVMSANFAFIIMILGLITYQISHIQSKQIKVGTSLLAVLLFSSISYFLYSQIKPSTNNNNFGKLEQLTALGNQYYHDTTILIYENGNHVMTYIQEEELRVEWNKSSAISYDSLDLKGQQLFGTLIRYITSKGLRKDHNGFQQLSEQDLRNIEMGIPSIRYNENPLMARIDGITHQIQYYFAGGPSAGHSLLQRFEHWRAGAHILKTNWLFGVGTGDVQKEFDQAYIAIETDLDESQRNRAHNQFLTFWVTFGILGFLILLLFSRQILVNAIKHKHTLGICFALITIASFLPEDTLETQQGVTFIAFFIGLFPEVNRRISK